MTGNHDMDWERDVIFLGIVSSVTGRVKFHAKRFACRVCGLQLDSVAELKAAGMESPMETGIVGPVDFNPPLTEDMFYEWLAEHSQVEE